MVIVDSIAVAIMISNHLAVPLVLRFHSARRHAAAKHPTRAPARNARTGDMTGFILAVRRVAIFAVVMLGYLYFRSARGEALAAIGLLSFAAIAQIFPSFLAALFWRRANARGALAALIAGSAIWIYTLLLPAFAGSRHGLELLIAHGPLGIAWLRPEHLLGLRSAPARAWRPVEPRGKCRWRSCSALSAEGRREWSAPKPASSSTARHARARRSSPRREPVSDRGSARHGCALSRPRSRGAAFESFLGGSGSPAAPDAPADVELVRRVEHLLSSAIGASSARLVLALLTRRPTVSSRDALQLLGDTSAALQQERDLLQHALDHARQGITRDRQGPQPPRLEPAWLELYDMPPDLVKAGMKLDEIVRFNARRGLYGEGDAEVFVEMRVRSFFEGTDPVRLRLYPSRAVIEVRSNPLPDGGVVDDLHGCHGRASPHRRSWRSPTRRSKGASRNAPASSSASMPSSSAPRRWPTRPMPRRRASSPPRATTSSSR